MSAAPRWLIGLVALALGACERASFESLGTLPASPAISLPLPDGGTPAAPAMSQDAGTDSGSPQAGSAGQPAAGSGTAAGAASAAGSGGMAGAGSLPRDAPLAGQLDTRSFDAVKSGFVIGYSDELGTTTLYLIDSVVSCSEVSSLAWLNKLPASTQVIELMFPSSAAPGSPVAGSLVSFARGGMYSFSKMRASSQTLVLSQNTAAGAVEGVLEATFSSGSVKGKFHADYCATGVNF